MFLFVGAMLARSTNYSGLEEQIQYCRDLGVSEVEFFDEGGQGKIFFGKHGQYGAVAVKIGKETGHFDAFDNECEAYRKIGDKAADYGINLPTIHEISDTNEHLIMEKIDDGEDFADLFAKGEYPLRDRLVLVKQALQQVQNLYSQFGIGHNDLKPANIMQRPDHYAHKDNKCYLIDLGSAMTDTELNEIAEEYGIESVGSNRYMHPARDTIFQICDEAEEPAIPYLQGYAAAVLIADAVLGEHGYNDSSPLEEDTLQDVIEDLKGSYRGLSLFLGDIFNEVHSNYGYSLEEVLSELSSALE